jgi:hypothetical protein
MAAIPGFVQVNTDDFNRADQNPIAGNWTDSTIAGNTDMQIITNKCAPVVFNAGDGDCFYSAWISGNDQYSQVEVTASGTSATSGLGPTVRRITTSGTNTMYRLVLDAGGNYELAKFLANVKTSLRTGTVTFVSGQKLGLSATGGATTTLKIWYNNVQIGTDAVDASSPILTGFPGIAYSSAITSASGDNWDAGIPDTGGFRKVALKPRPFKPAFVRRR